MKGFFIGVGVGAVVFSVGLGGLISLTDYGVDQSKVVLKEAVREANRQQAESRAKIEADSRPYGAPAVHVESQPADNERTVEQFQDEINALEARVAALHEEQMAKIHADLAKE